MRTFREQKRLAREQLHTALSEPVLYFSDLHSEPVMVTVRLHLNFALLGDLLATRVGFGEARELTPRIIFWNNEKQPKRDSYVVTKDMGAFYIDNVAEPDDVTTTAYVAQILPETAERHGWDVKAPWFGIELPEGTL